MKCDQLIVARAAKGEVEAAGWDCPETRKDAREWLSRGLTLEIVTPEQIKSIPSSQNVFTTTRPLGQVLTREQAIATLS